jgi:hypothetical protein
MDTVNEQIAVAPLPTPKTLKLRKSLPVQAARFVALNLRIVRMVARGHR